MRRRQTSGRGSHGKRRGQALAEFAVAVPILVLLLFGLIEVGFMIKSKMVLQDAVREAARYGAQAGTFDAPNGNTAPGCLADYAVLAEVSARLQNSIVDSSRLRSVFLYAATDSGNTPRQAPATTSLPSPQPQHFPSNAPALNGDYYYANYDTRTGQDIDPSTAAPPILPITGTGNGAIYRLFHGSGVDSIFATSLVTPTYPMGSTPPTCGSTINATGTDTHGATISCFGYDDSRGDGSYSQGPAWNPSCLVDDSKGNWPPAWRNNQSEMVVNPDGTHTPWPDVFGVDIVYDYQFHTPLFQVFSSIFTGPTHTFRMDEHAAFVMNPPA